MDGLARSDSAGSSRPDPARRPTRQCTVHTTARAPVYARIVRPPDVDALLTLVSFTRDRGAAMRDEGAAERLLMLTTMRSNNTALAIVNLLELDSIEQAQMLCRSLFEDMAVVHWLVMQEDPAFLVERFFDSQDAIALAEHDFVTDEMRLPHDLPPWLGDLQSRRDELRKTFGTSAQHSWWGIDRNGKTQDARRCRTRDQPAPRVRTPPERRPRASAGQRLLALQQVG
jgi:hypothetical protein